MLSELPPHSEQLPSSVSANLVTILSLPVIDAIKSDFWPNRKEYIYWELDHNLFVWDKYLRNKFTNL